MVLFLSWLLGIQTNGHFITFEGIEGCGKSTQVALLADALVRRGYRLVVTREPGGTELGQRLRALLLGATVPVPPVAELLIYLADRVCHQQEVIVPALKAGHVVLCDRFCDSTVAYQGFGRGLDLALVKRWEQQARSGLCPALTILLDCPVELGLARIEGRGAKDRLEREKHDFHQRVRQGFLQLAADEPGRIRIVDATRPSQEVHAIVLSTVINCLGGK